MSDELLEYLRFVKKNAALARHAFVRHIGAIYCKLVSIQKFLKYAKTLVSLQCNDLVKSIRESDDFARVYSGNEDYWLKIIVGQAYELELQIMLAYNTYYAEVTRLAKEAVGVIGELIVEVSQLQKNECTYSSRTTHINTRFRDTVNCIIQDANECFAKTLNDMEHCQRVMQVLQP